MKFNTDLLNNINNVLENIVTYIGQFGPIGAILMAFFEAVFPSLPLVAIAGVNYKNYGIIGFVLTTLGSALGMIFVFILIRKFLSERLKKSKFFSNRQSINKFLLWIERKGFSSVIVLMCFPFIPTSILNYALALSNIKFKDYLYIVFVSRVVAISLLSYLGSSLFDFIENPRKAIISVIALVIVYFVSKYIEKRID